jgi:two-component system LytT family response regulator
MALRVLIVDDEPLACRGLQLRLSRYADVEVVGEARNGREAISAVKTLRPHLMFLDVQLPGTDGFGVLRRLSASNMPLIVFVTAFDRYAVNAFAAYALDYLVKPINSTRLAQALARARAHLDVGERGRSSRKLCLRTGHKIARIDADEIAWIDAAGDYICIHVGAETHVVRETMDELERRLDSNHFARVHRSTIVNLTRIKEMRPHTNGEYFLLLDTGQEIKLSRTYKEKIRLLL